MASAGHAVVTMQPSYSVCWLLSGLRGKEKRVGVFARGSGYVEGRLEGVTRQGEAGSHSFVQLICCSSMLVDF